MKRSLRQIVPVDQNKSRKRATRRNREIKRLNAIVSNLKAENKDLQSQNALLKKEKREVLAWISSQKAQKTNLPGCTIDNLPTDVVHLIINYFVEFEKFQLRVLNTIFYKAYFNQTFACRTSVNYKRVTRLGALGRSFPKLTHLRIYYDSLDRDMLRFVDKTIFPNLELFAVEKLGTEVDLSKLPAHPKIKTMGLYNLTPYMLEYVTEAKFPSLELIDFYPSRCSLYENYLTHLKPNRILKQMEFFNLYNLDIDDWRVITKQRFPKLETILYRDGHADMLPEVLEYFRQQGINFRPEQIPELSAEDNQT